MAKIMHNKTSEVGKEPNILVVAHASPWPPTSGGKIDMFGRLKALREMGVKVELIMTVKENSDDHKEALIDQFGLESCHVIERRRTVGRSLHPVWPFQIFSRTGGEWETIAANLGQKYFAAVLAEGSYVFPMSYRLARKMAVPLMHRIHNIESQYFISLGKSEINYLKKTFYYLEALRFKILERRMFQGAINLCISTEELEWLNSTDSGQSFWLPPALSHFPERGACYLTGEGKNFLITGNLIMPDTLNGVLWFVQHIWPNLLQRLPDATLTIAGRRPGESAAQYFQSIPGVNLAFDVSDMSGFFLNADIYVSPTRHGTGVKIKTVEALSYGLPVVATSIAAQGCRLEHGKHLLIADHKDDFRHLCIELAQNHNLRSTLGTAGRAYIRETFDHKQQLEKILQHLKIVS
jgi:polysaccharide biosynthesis protein PslH